jgi:TP901 family phage tail tape measure protein
MTNMTASFILKLEDKLSGGLAKLQRTFEALKRTAERINLGGLAGAGREIDGATAGANRLAGALGRIERAAHGAMGALGRLASRAGAGIRRAADHIGVIGGVAAGYSVMAPIRAYAGYEAILRQTAITEQLSGPAAAAEIRRLRAMFNRDALATGQPNTVIAHAFNDLVRRGVPLAEAERLIGIHSRAATAYGIDPEALGQTVGALSQNLGIGAEDMEGTLAAMAFAAKNGAFSVGDFANFIPQATATFGKLGMKGRGAANTAFAALETIRQNTGDASTAATDLNDLMNYLTSNFAKRSFAHIGVDIDKYLLDAEKKGINPLDAVLSLMKSKFQGLSPVAIAQQLGLSVHNMQGRDALVALLQHDQYFDKLRALLGGQNAGTLDRDFITMFQSPKIQLAIFAEQLGQLTQRMGEGFEPILEKVNLGLSWLSDWLNRLDQQYPGASGDFMLGIGLLLTSLAALGAIGFVMPAVVAGFGLLADLLALGGTVLGGLVSLGALLGGSVGTGMTALGAALLPEAPVLVGLALLAGAVTVAAYSFRNLDPTKSKEANYGLTSGGLNIAEMSDADIANFKAHGGLGGFFGQLSSQLGADMRSAGEIIGRTAASIMSTLLGGGQAGGVPNLDFPGATVPNRGLTTGRP